MNDYAHPGVYIQEVGSGPGPITGVSSSIMGLIGSSPKGLVNQPIACTSFPEFASKFGGFNSDGISAHEAYAFFANGGQVMYFVRVAGAGALKALYTLATSLQFPESHGLSQSPSGAYDFTLNYSPVHATSPAGTITFTHGDPDNVYVLDIGSGTLSLNYTLSGSLAQAAGASGSINMETGEVHVQLGNPSLYAGGGVSVQYSYKMFTFQMRGPGASGNFFRVRIAQGSDDYMTTSAYWTRHTIYIDEDLNQDPANRAWATRETWADVSLSDATSPWYAPTMINAAGTGSEIIEIIDHGHPGTPPGLYGNWVSNEDISLTQRKFPTDIPPIPFDNSKQYQWTLVKAPFVKSLVMAFRFADSNIKSKGTATAGGATLTDSTQSWVVNEHVGAVVHNLSKQSSGIVTANTATTMTAVLYGGTGTTWDIGDLYAVAYPQYNQAGSGDGTGVASIVSPGTAAVPAQVVPGTVVVMAYLTPLADYVKCVDDGAGNIVGDIYGTPTNVATINYTTGQITGTTSGANKVDIVDAYAGQTVQSGTAIFIGCIYAVDVLVTDDENNNMIMSPTQNVGRPQKFVLDQSSVNTVNRTSKIVTLTWKNTRNPASGPSGAYLQSANYYENPASVIELVLSNGYNGADLTSSDIVGADLAVDQEGVYSFGKVDEIMQLVAADFQTDVTVSGGLVDYCELMKDKFALLTVPHGLSYQEAVNWKRYTLNKPTSRAAIYYPHIKVLDPVTNINVDIPCGGHVAGIYARTDAERNVGEAPAGMQKALVRWATGLELDLTETQVGLVYNDKINAIVQWPHTGRVLWGARTMDIAGGEWNYIQTRRLFMYVEKSVYRATHLHVFENNGPSLWSKIYSQVNTYLLGLYNSGYFAGTSPAEAYFVICDSTNNPTNTQRMGIVFCDVGIASNVPGEFLVFRFQQKALAAAA